MNKNKILSYLSIAALILVSLPVFQKQVLGAGTPAFVQSGTCNGSSTNCMVNLNTTANNLIVVAAYGSSDNGVMTASDSAGNNYSNACGYVTEPVSGRSMEILYFVPTTALSSVTISRSGSAGNILAWVGEYAGMVTSSVLDQCATGQNQNTASWATLNTPATTNATDLFFSSGWTNAGVFSAGSGFTLRSNIDAVHFTEDRNVSSTGTYAAIAANTQQSYGPMVTVLFKARTTGPVDTTVPTAPSGLLATAISSSVINLSWTASTDAVGVIGYKIFRNGSQVGTSASVNYSDAGLTSSTNYSYTVSAYDAAGNNSAQSASANVATQALSVDTTAPTTPSSLSATAVSSSVVNLTWTASTDAVGVTGYKIFRAGSQIGTSASSNYSDSGLTAATNYSYTVSAYDPAGNNSAQSTSANVTTQSGTVAPGLNLYISQSGSGTQDASSCANAKAVSFFNTSSNWGSAVGKIGPGTTVHLCGTFTFGANSTGLSAQGSGSPGNPITILFEPGAILQAPSFGAGGAAIRLDNQNYITVDGGGTGNAGAGTFTTSGIIQATLSGTSGGACIGGPCQYNTGGTGINAENTNGIVIKNLHIRNMYLRSSFADQAVDWAAYFCVHASPSSNLLIDNNYMHDSGEILAPNGNNVTISNNYLAQTNHEISMGAGATSWSNIYIFDNHFGPMDSWDAGAPFPYHHDGVHLFPGEGGSLRNVFIYNNNFDGDIGSVSVTGWIYAEQTCCTSGTISIFNNVVSTSPYRSAPALLGIFSGTINFYNNTVTSPGFSNGGAACNLGLGDAFITGAKNNICGTQSYGFVIQTGTTVSGIGAVNYNLFVDGSASGNSSNFGVPGNDTQSLAAWRNIPLNGATTHDANSQLATLAAIKLNSNGTLQAGSPAIGTGTNLFSVCNGQSNPGLGALCFDKAGVARPSSGAWDIGAYQVSSGGGTPTPLPGDFNLDHVVNSLDYSLLNSNWFKTANISTYDLQVDGIINSFDYAILKSNWGKTW